MNDRQLVNAALDDARREATQLVQARPPMEVFYQRLIDLFPVPAGTLGISAWRCLPNELAALASGSRNPRAGVYLNISDADRASILVQARDERTPRIVDPTTTVGYQVYGDSQAPLLAVLPVVSNGETTVLIEIYLPLELLPAEQDWYLDQWQDFTKIAEGYHQLEVAQGEEFVRVSGARDTFVAAVHRSLELNATCYAIVNEGRRLVGCDRVSVLTCRGGSFKVVAISGQDSVNSRANVVTLLQDLTRSVTALGTPFWYPDPTSTSQPPQIESVLDAYLDLAHSQGIGIVPLFALASDAADTTTGDRPARQEKAPGRRIGALVVEHFSAGLTDSAAFREEVTFLATHSEMALGHAKTFHEVLLLPLWRRLGELRELAFGTYRRKTLSILGLLVGSMLALCFLRADFYIVCDGKLQPETRHHIFAPLSGIVRDVHVEHGDDVAAGDVLVTLRSPELDLAEEELEGEIQVQQSRLASIRSMRVIADRKPESMSDARAAAAEEANLQKALESMYERQAIQAELRDSLAVRSPVNGRVLTWNPQELLRSRPVERGQRMLDVANLDEGWVLELRVPDRHVGYLMDANSTAKEPLRVQFLLASDPRHKYLGTVRHVAHAMRVDPQVGNFALATVDVDREGILWTQPDVEVQARVYCGRRSIGYLWLHDVVSFLRTRVFFRWI